MKLSTCGGQFRFKGWDGADIVDLSLLSLITVAAVFAGALAQATTGMGFSLVAAPALIGLLGQQNGVSVTVLLAALAALIPLFGHWRAVQLKEMSTILIPTLLATPVIAWVLLDANTSVLTAVAGLGVIAGVFALWRGMTWRRLRSIPGAIGTGLASAFLNVVGGVGGPPIGIYAANAAWDPRTTRATLQAFFLVQNIVTAVVVGLILPSWWMVAALVVGTVVGMVVAPRIPTNAARIAVLVVAAGGGLALILGSF